MIPQLIDPKPETLNEVFVYLPMPKPYSQFQKVETWLKDD